MKKIVILFVCSVILSIFGVGQVPELDSVTPVSYVNSPTKLSVDTLKIQNVTEKATAKVWYENESLPWISAFLLSFIGIIINILITKKQITANHVVAITQIKATLKTNNRQEWITETRNALSNFITQCKLLNAEFQEVIQIPERKKLLHENVTLYRTKLLLLLNPEDDKHNALISSMKEMVNTLDKHLFNRKAKDELNMNIAYDNGTFLSQMSDVTENGRNVLYSEWKKIQSAGSNSE